MSVDPAVTLKNKRESEADGSRSRIRAIIKKMSKEERAKRRRMIAEELSRISLVLQQIEEREMFLKEQARLPTSDSIAGNGKAVVTNLDTYSAEGAERTSFKKDMEDSDFCNGSASKPTRKGRTFNRQTSLQFSDSTFGPPSKEKRTPKANSAYINQDFLSGRDKLPPPEKAKGKGTPLKRGSFNGEFVSLRRQKVEAAREKRSLDMMKMCSTALKRLLTHKWAWVFDKPVDPVALNIPDYFNVIRQPMDLGTVNANLKAEAFKSPMDFARDVRLVFSNAMTYNPPQSDVHIMAKEMGKVFESTFGKIEAKFAEEKIRQAEEEQELASAPTEKEREVEELHRRLQRLESQVDLKEKRVRGPPGAGKGRAVQRPRMDDTEKRPMTFAEKRKLSVNLGQLPADKLGTVVQIISAHQPNLRQEDDEIELDIDSLDNDTLWALEKYVSEIIRGKGKVKKSQVDNGDGLHGRMSETGEASQLKDEDDEVDIEEDFPAKTASNTGFVKGAAKSSSSGSSGSSDGSGSSSSGSESGSGSSGSESENEDGQSKVATSRMTPLKEPAGSGAEQGLKVLPSASKPIDGEVKAETVTAVAEEKKAEEVLGSEGATKSGAEGESGKKAPPPPKKDKATMYAEFLQDPDILEKAMQRGRFLNTFLNARRKTFRCSYGSKRIPPEAEAAFELILDEEKKWMVLEYDAAKEAHGKIQKEKDALAAQERKRKREEDREAAREALKAIRRTVEVNECPDALKDMPDFENCDILARVGLVPRDSDDETEDTSMVQGEGEEAEKGEEQTSEESPEKKRAKMEQSGPSASEGEGEDKEEGEIGMEDN